MLILAVATRFDLFDTNAFKHCFALALGHDEHAFWNFARPNKCLTKLISALFYIENHLQKVETLCRLKGRIFPEPVEAHIVLIARIILVKIVLH